MNKYPPPNKTRIETCVRVRKIENPDIPFILNNFDCPWNEEDFFRFRLRYRGCTAVAQHSGFPVGFLLFKRTISASGARRTFEIVQLEVHREFRRTLIGTKLLIELARLMPVNQVDRIGVDVSERNLDAQLFLRHLGFVCVRIDRNAYESGDSSYRMVYTSTDDVKGDPFSVV